MHVKHLNRARILMEQERYDLAAKELKNVLKYQPQHNESLGMLAYALARLGRLEESETCFQSTLSLDPFNIHGLYSKMEVSLQKDKYADFLKKLQQAQSVLIGDAHLIYLHAFFLFTKSDWQASVNMAEKGLVLAPTNQNLLNIRTRALVMLDNPIKASQSANLALSINPLNAKVIESKAWLALRNEDWEQAKLFFKEVLRLSPNSTTARKGLIDAIKAKYIGYKYLLNINFWNVRRPKVFGYILITAFVLLLPMIFLLDKFEDTAYEEYIEILMLFVLSPFLFMGLFGMMNGLYDGLMIFDKEGKSYLGEKEIENGKGCFTVIVILGISIILIFVGIWLSNKGI